MLKEWYEKINYKKLMIVPVIILILCMIPLVMNYQKTGEFVSKGIDLTGGSQVSVSTNSNVDLKDLERYLSKRFGSVEVRSTISVSGKTLLIRCRNVDEKELVKGLKEYGIEVESYSFQNIGASLGKTFFSQTKIGIIAALISMAVVVFIVFKNFIPSIAVISAAITDMLCALGFTQAIGMDLSLASFAGLLMVIGYSIDTDILLTTRVLKRREGEMIERISRTLKTGLTMTSTTLAALFVLYFVSGSGVLQEIATILIVALAVDVPSTYLMNLGILRWWMEKKGIE